MEKNIKATLIVSRFFVIVVVAVYGWRGVSISLLYTPQTTLPVHKKTTNLSLLNVAA